MKTTKSVKAAPLYSVVGTINQFGKITTRVFPLTRARLKDGIWVYPSGLGNKHIPEKSVGSVYDLNFQFSSTKKETYKRNLVTAYCEKVDIQKMISAVTASIKESKDDKKTSNPEKTFAPIVAEKKFLGKDLEDINAVNDILSGKKNSFSVLYKRYYPIIHRKYVVSLHLNTDIADDLTMELFEKVYKNIAEYKPNYTFNDWITRVAKNFLIDYFRKSKLNTISIDTGFSGGEESADEGFNTFQPKDETSLNGEQLLIKDETALMVQTALGKLNPRNRRILEMKYFQDKTYEQIANAEDVPVDTVKVIIFRSKAQLKDIMSANKTTMALVTTN